MSVWRFSVEAVIVAFQLPLQTDYETGAVQITSDYPVAFGLPGARASRSVDEHFGGGTQHDSNQSHLLRLSFFRHAMSAYTWLRIQARGASAARRMVHGTIRRHSRQRIICKIRQLHSGQNEVEVHDARSLNIIEVNGQHVKRMA